MTTLWQDVVYGFRMLTKEARVHGDRGAVAGIGHRREHGNFQPGEHGAAQLAGLSRSQPPGNDRDNAARASRDDRGRDGHRLHGVERTKPELRRTGSDRYSRARLRGGRERHRGGATRTAKRSAQRCFRFWVSRPILGRIFTEEEDPIGTPARVMLISYRLWQRRYASDPNIAGKTIQMGRR